jgi:hypothetical protein
MKLEDLSSKPGKRCDEKAKEADCLKREPFRRSGLGDDVILYIIFIRLRGDSIIKP